MDQDPPARDEQPPLSPEECPAEPHELFDRWFGDARDADVPLPHAMVLSTATLDGMPSARAVLMKDHGPAGITFFSNANSRKGQDLAMNPLVALTFVWTQLDRQVRVEGRAEQVPDEVVDAYWLTRPPRARAGAAVSPQSRSIESRQDLLGEVERIAEENPDGVPRPAHWVGWQVTPSRWEFWQGRPDRLHDRVQYDLDPTGQAGGTAGWQRRRLAP